MECYSSGLRSDHRPKVTVYTQVFNTKPFLAQCIESVLSQTFSDFEYILVDNGCTDGSSEIIDRYAERDSRIKLIRHAKNQLGFWHPLICERAAGAYLSILDSDDWWDLDYLERMMNFLETNDLDLVVTGTVQYVQAYGAEQTMRKLDAPIALTQTQFAQYYSQLWAFPSTNWGTIMKMNLFRKMDVERILREKYPYGGDTMTMLQYIKQCSRIGIDNSALYHYRIHPKSVSYQYNPRRFDANIAIYKHIREFLELHHTFDLPKQEWLKQVHLSSMTATLGLLKDAQMSEEEKMAECARIVAHPLTAVALTNDCTEREQWYAVMWETISLSLAGGILSTAENLYPVLKTLSPRCWGAVRTENLGLFAREAALREALRKDDRDGLTASIMGFITQKRYIKQYDLGQMLCGVIPDSSPLRGIADSRFFREYAESCALILQENYSDALDQMTGLLLEGKKLYNGEQFLDLYLSLAALEDHAPAFVFGKLRLAQLYLRQNRREECRAAVAELTEMGLDDEELTALRRELEGAP